MENRRTERESVTISLSVWAPNTGSPGSTDCNQFTNLLRNGNGVQTSTQKYRQMVSVIASVQRVIDEWNVCLRQRFCPRIRDNTDHRSGTAVTSDNAIAQRCLKSMTLFNSRLSVHGVFLGGRMIS
jgi:hypothetical protein